MTDESGIVVFNSVLYGEWLFEYPEFAGVTSDQAQRFFNMACVYIDNTPLSVVPYLDPGGSLYRVVILKAAMAHLAYLFAAINGQGPRQTPGMVNSATEGSVSIGMVYMTPRNDLEAWWNQSSYGAFVWAALLQFRTARYYPPPRWRRCGGFYGRGMRGLW